MPVRKVAPVTEGKEDKKLLNLEFLPREYVVRIDDIFDSYFNLGMKPNKNVIEGESSPMFPKQISSLSSPQLGDILGEFTAWFSFTSDKLKYVAVATNYMETELNKILDRELSTMIADKGNVDTKKSAAKNSNDYIVTLSYLQKLRGMKSMLDYELEAYDKSISSISREVSRREHHGGF